jgi:hypothetical protein
VPSPFTFSTTMTVLIGSDFCNSCQDVLDALLESRQGLTVEELQKRTGFAPSPGTALREELQANEKVEITPDGLFLYKVCLIQGRLQSAPVNSV